MQGFQNVLSERQCGIMKLRALLSGTANTIFTRQFITRYTVSLINGKKKMSHFVICYSFFFHFLHFFFSSFHTCSMGTFSPAWISVVINHLTLPQIVTRTAKSGTFNYSYFAFESNFINYKVNILNAHRSCELELRISYYPLDVLFSVTCRHRCEWYKCVLYFHRVEMIFLLKRSDLIVLPKKITF